MKIDNFIIQVTPEQSKVVQETLFANGCKWEKRNEVSHIDKPYLYNRNSIITWSNSGSNNGMETITYQQFCDLYISFVLPKCWCIERTKDNYKVINDWCNSNLIDNDEGNYELYEGFVYSNNVSSNNHNRLLSKKIDNYTEITFEQFKQYVLTQDNKQEFNIAYNETISNRIKDKVMNKEIIRYKINTLGLDYKEAINIILPVTHTIDSTFSFDIGSVTADKLKKAGVLDLWFETIYKKSSPLVYPNPTIKEAIKFFDNRIEFAKCSIPKTIFIAIYNCGITIDSISINDITFTGRDVIAIAKYFLDL